MDEELTDSQLDRLDYVHNAIWNLVKKINPNRPCKRLEWDMEIIGEISDAIEEYLVKKGLVLRWTFTVHLNQPVFTWESVEAKNEKDAIKICVNSCLPPYAYDPDEPVFMEALEEEKE